VLVAIAIIAINCSQKCRRSKKKHKRVVGGAVPLGGGIVVSGAISFGLSEV
jgi:hypothetical protein